MKIGGTWKDPRQPSRGSLRKVDSAPDIFPMRAPEGGRIQGGVMVAALPLGWDGATVGSGAIGL
jgi:hypothetical protein